MESDPVREKPTQTCIIQSASPADLDAVVEIERLSFRTPWTRQAFSDELTRTWARVDVLRETAIGPVLAFANYWLVADELHILNIATHPDARRRGHAARMLAHIVDLAKQASFRMLILEVRKSNLAAQTLYRSFGFQQTGMRPQYYEDNGEDALLMTLEMG